MPLQVCRMYTLTHPVLWILSLPKRQQNSYIGSEQIMSFLELTILCGVRGRNCPAFHGWLSQKKRTEKFFTTMPPHFCHFLPSRALCNQSYLPVSEEDGLYIQSLRGMHMKSAFPHMPKEYPT